MSKTRCYSIDLYKLILSLIIVALHFNWQFVPQGYLAVETFFLISGFFSALNKKKTEQNSLFSLCLNKFKKIYPIYALMIIIWAIVVFFVYQNTDLVKQLPAYLSMFYAFTTKGTGYNYIGYLGYLWFIPVYFLCYIVIAFISKNLDRQKSTFSCMVTAVLSASLLVYFSESGGLNYSIEDLAPVHTGVLRGLMDMSIGYIAGMLGQEAKTRLGSERKLYQVLVCTIFELLGVLYSLFVVSANVSVLYDYSYIIVSAALIVLFDLNIGLIGRAMDRIASLKYMRYLTGASMSLYMVHGLVINLYKLCSDQDSSERGFLICVGISILAALLLEILDKLFQNKVMAKLAAVQK